MIVPTRTRVIRHSLLLMIFLIMVFPIYIAFVASTHSLERIMHPPFPLLPGRYFFETYGNLLFGSVNSLGDVRISKMLLNSAIMAFGIAFGKIFISLLSAYAIVFFRFPLRMFFFWMIFFTLMLPVEVRIVPTFHIAAQLNLLDSYAGLILPLIASATATFLFRQFFMTIPKEMVEAAKMDASGPIRFFWKILLPMSRTNIAALFVILFLYGWNQYLWPLLITNNEDMMTIVISIKKMLSAEDSEIEWSYLMATSLLALIPPVTVVLMLQRLFIKGLIDSEK